MKESALVLKIKEGLRAKYPQAFIVKIHGGMFQSAGIPDLICCIEGRFIGIEVKLPGKERTLSKLQQMHIRLIRKAGGLAFMTTSVDHTLEEARKYLEG